MNKNTSVNNSFSWCAFRRGESLPRSRLNLEKSVSFYLGHGVYLGTVFNKDGRDADSIFLRAQVKRGKPILKHDTKDR